MIDDKLKNTIKFNTDDAGSVVDILSPPLGSFEIFDESLRDGIQSPTVRKPSIEEKYSCIDHMINLGVESADLGFPGASEKMVDECIRLVRYVKNKKCGLHVALAGRTHPDDVLAICNVVEASGELIDAYLFVAVSKIRCHVERWTFDDIRKRIVSSHLLCVAGGANFVLVLEDTLRCDKTLLAKIYSLAIDLGVGRVVLCDTVGCALPTDTYVLIRWTKDFFKSRRHSIKIDWHGHNDRGLALINSMVATSQGCDRIHGTILGVGERAGNAALDHLVANYYLMGWKEYDLKILNDYSKYAAKIFDQPISKNYPVFGDSVFTTSAGVHASAIAKAELKDCTLTDYIYSSFPAEAVGQHQKIVIDAFSGGHNVRHSLKNLGVPADDYLVRNILKFAKSSEKPISDDDIIRLVSEREGNHV